jgi:hypothetical protein
MLSPRARCVVVWLSALSEAWCDSDSPAGAAPGPAPAKRADEGGDRCRCDWTPAAPAEVVVVGEAGELCGYAVAGVGSVRVIFGEAGGGVTS